MNETDMRPIAGRIASLEGVVVTRAECFAVEGPYRRRDEVEGMLEADGYRIPWTRTDGDKFRLYAIKGVDFG